MHILAVTRSLSALLAFFPAIIGSEPLFDERRDSIDGQLRPFDYNLEHVHRVTSLSVVSLDIRQFETPVKIGFFRPIETEDKKEVFTRGRYPI